MSSLKLKSSKIIAMLLAVVMLISMVPVSMITAFATEDIEYFVVTVTDSVTGDPIADAEVCLEASNTDWTLEVEPALTNEEGKAEFEISIISDSMTNAEITEAALNVIVKKNGYENYSESEVINIDNLTVSKDVSLVEKEKITLSGTVTDENDLAYEGATVKMTGSLSGEATTDADGNYSFQVYKGFGEYTITATATDDKYLTATTTVSAPAENYTCETLKFEVKQYKVSTVAGENGTITDTDTVAYGENKEITATADEFYRIEKFEVDGEAIEDAVGKDTYSYTIENITSEKNIEVTFVRYSYKITFTVDKDGKVEYNDGSEQTVEGGSVSVDKEVAIGNGTVTVVAKPSENYRVSKVVVDNISEEFKDNDKKYSYTFEMNKDHTFEVEFSINTFSVETVDGDNGTSSVDASTVEYGNNAEVTITPNDGYNIEKVTINGIETTEYTLNDDGKTYTLQINNIKEDTKVEVEYSEIESIAFDDELVNISKDYFIKTNEEDDDVITYIYDKDATVKLTTTKNRISINGNRSINNNVEEFSESIRVEKIEVYDGYKWNNVTLEKNIQIVIDKEAPVVNPDSSELGWTKEEIVEISGFVTDSNSDDKPSSGLSYIVWSKDAALTEDAVLTATENKVALGVDGEYKFTSVDGEQNARYYIYAVDISGNVSIEKTVDVKIDTKDPTIEKFEFSIADATKFEKFINFLTFGTMCSETMYVKVYANDEEITSGLKDITLYCNKEVLDTKQVSGNYAIFELTESRFKNGVAVSAIVTDIAGNKSKETEPNGKGASSDVVYIDGSTRPVVKFTLDTPGNTDKDEKLWYKNNDINLKIEVKDENTGIGEVSVYLNGTDITKDCIEHSIYAKFSEERTNKIEFVINTSEYANDDGETIAHDGKNVIEVVVTNNVGISETMEQSVYIDTKDPTIEKFEFSTKENKDIISFLSFGTMCSETMYVKVYANDEDITSGLKDITLYCDKEVLDTKQVSGNYAIFELTESRFKNGVAVSAIVTDIAGNKSKETEPNGKGASSDVVYIDGSTKPVATITPDTPVYIESENKWWYNDNLALTIVAKDENTGIRSVSVKLNGTDITTDFEGKSINQEFFKGYTNEEEFVINTSQNTRDGENVIEVVVTNNVGISETVTKSVYIDTTSPDISKFEIAHSGDTPLGRVLNFLTFGMFSNHKVEVTVTASDSNASSGVNTITLYVDEEVFETKTVSENKATFVIPAEEITDNTKHFDKVISAKAVDFVGYETADFILPHTLNSDIQNSGLMIETIKPTISVSYDDAAQNKNVDTADANDWYKEDVEFTVDVADADSGIRNVKISINGTLVDEDLYATENHSKQYTVNTSDAKRNADGSYTIEVVVIDNAGNVSETYSKTIYKDIDNPYITGFDFDAVEYVEGSETASTVEVTDYGFYFKTDTKVTISAKDDAPSAGVKSITYYTVDKDTGKSAETTVDVNKDGQIEFTIEANFKGQIYAKATDNVDNVADQFVNPNSAIVEDESKHKEESHIVFTKDDTEFTINDGENKELYANDVPVKLTVIDTYSGIRSIEWSVVAPYDTENNQSGNITVNNDTTFTSDSEEGWIIVEQESNLVIKMEKDIVVKNNSNNIIVTVKMVDRAGNTSEDKIEFSIDKTIPVIEVVYDNNEPDAEYNDIYKADREATITITERNFRAEDIVFAITNTDKAIPAVDLTKADVWTTMVNEEDPDKTIHVAKIKYTADGDYTFDIAYKDNAENAADVVEQHKFTIDKTIPVVTVVYNNNDVRNGNYYKADRTATITITEHNFDAKRVKIFEATPVISNWKSEGDIHTATITYNTDGKYTLDIEFMDMAGNSIDDFVAQEFYIDKTNPIVTISDIVDQSANNNDGNIGFSITATDDNFDVFTPVLSVVVMIDGVFESKNLTIGNTDNITNGQKYTVTNIDTDGIYSITCTVVDKAGNAYSEVILEDANGKTYVEKRSGSDTLVTFSVNRNGSVFALDSYTDELVKTYYVNNVTDNVTIIEINADPILENTVTLNGKTLVEDVDYTVTLDNTGSWHKYFYSLNKSLFDGESEYNIVVSSKDKASNEAFSDIKNVAVKFVVDRTAPIVTVAGIKTNGRYQVDKQIVTLVPADDGGALKSLIVRTVDENGKLIKELINLSGDELIEAIANGSITFELEEGLYQNVQIICEDYAGNIVGKETNEIYSNVSISSSAVMIFWANKPLRWGSIAGVILLAAAIVVLVIYKKNKKDNLTI